MIITNKLNMDLQNPGSTPIINAVQCDSSTRALEITLSCGGVPFCPPDHCRAVIRFRKIDGKGGEYDTLPNGESASSVAGNLLTVVLAPQVFTVPGSVSLSVSLIADNEQLGAFPILIYVDPVSFANSAKSENYFYTTGFLNAPDKAQVGQFLKISAVNEEGRITATEAVFAGSGGQEADPTVPDWAKQPSKPTYTAQEVNARPDTWLPTAAEIGAQPAGSYLTEVPSGYALKSDLAAAVNEGLEQAKQSGEFDGAQGEPGADGISPAVAVSKTGKITTISITDANGTHTAQIHDGEDGAAAGDAEALIPDYWQEHLDSRIARIKALQDAGGKDCFSYVVLTDMHLPSNLGKCSPVLAKAVMDECNIKFALCLGDVRTRGILGTREQAQAEWEAVEEMLSPIRGRLLQTQGNHDAGFGSGDSDSNGNNDSCAYEFTPGEMFERVYRKASLVGNAHYDASGTAYYVDDVSNKVRYIMLNTHLNFDGNAGYDSYETVNGMAKHPSVTAFRYTQCQYNFLTDDALATVPGDDWSVILGSHVPINQTGEMPEYPVMVGVLNAYAGKTAYSGNYEGTAGGLIAESNFTDLCDEASADFLVGQRIDSTGAQISATSQYCISNYIPAAFNKTSPNVLRIKGFHPEALGDIRIAMFDANKNRLGSSWHSYGAYPGDFTVSEDSVISWNVGNCNSYMSSSTYGSTAYVRVTCSRESADADLIITVNEEIAYTEGESIAGYDHVAVDCDFSGAKGNLISYHGGHTHADTAETVCWNGPNLLFPIITTRCDAVQENTAEDQAERIQGTTTEQSFDVFTVNTKARKIYATKIGAGSDREISC